MSPAPTACRRGRRVLLLPFIGEEDPYKQYRFDEPWNGLNNSKLADKLFTDRFQCTSGPKYPSSLHTNYVAVVGRETAFPMDGATAIADFKDGLGNSILLVEIGNSDIHWMEPRDLAFENVTLRCNPAEASSSCISSHHPAGPAVVFADRISAYRAKAQVSDPALRGLLTIAGGEKVDRRAVNSRLNP